MLTINVTSNIAETIKRLQAQAKQVAYAEAVALTRSAKQGAADAQAESERQLDRPTPFTVKSIRWQGATKATLQSKVYIMPTAAAYLRPLIEGGINRPTKGRALVLPGADKLNQYGNIPRTRVRQLLKQKSVFSGTIKGIGGIWRRDGRGGVKLLIRFEDEQAKKKQFDFPGIVRKSVERNFPRLFRQALEEAMRTAR